MLPRNEDDTDRLDARRRTELRPVSNIAIQDQTAREKTSQTLVDEAIQDEQRKIRIAPIIQELPSADLQPFRDNVEEILTVNPAKFINPVKVVPKRTTISGRIKERMGVANIRARIGRGAIPGRLSRIETRAIGQRSAFGTDPKARRVGNTPVGNLGWLDQFFNWLNAFLS